MKEIVEHLQPEIVVIFIDSPGGREIEKETIERVLETLSCDFTNNQKFICSIYKFERLNVLDEQLLNFDNLKPFDRKSLFD